MSIFSRKPKAHQAVFLVLHLNARLQPMHRGALEDLLDAELARGQFSSRVGGGGTLTTAEGQLLSCDIELELMDPIQDIVPIATNLLERAGAPIGSWAGLTEEKSEPFGKMEAVSLRITPALTAEFLDNEVPLSTELSDLMLGINELLRADGFVASWHMRDEATEIFVHGPSARIIEQKIRAAENLGLREFQFEQYATRP
jgi:hypothetical protein